MPIHIHTCRKCGHEWPSKRPAEEIETCPNPKCRTRLWNRERKQN